MREIRESGALPDAEKLKESIKSFKERFSPSEETADKEDQEKTEERQEDSAEQKAEDDAGEGSHSGLMPFSRMTRLHVCDSSSMSLAKRSGEPVGGPIHRCP